jgi:hypothetical protein
MHIVIDRFKSYVKSRSIGRAHEDEDDNEHKSDNNEYASIRFQPKLMLP